jgi:3-mercaptopyruvate sulfurtransferase SseA
MSVLFRKAGFEKMPQEKYRNPGRWPLIFLAMGILLMVGAVGWVVANLTRPTQVATAPPTAVQDRIPYANITRVSLPDAKAAYELKTAVFLDIRGEPYYSESHIPGALSISLDELSQRWNELKPQDWIITYCT